MAHSLRSILVFTALTFIIACGPKAASQTGLEFKVSGRITQTHSYCGGARPPEDLLKKLNTPAPYSGKKLFVRSGTSNSTEKSIIREFTADSSGYFSIQLPAGTYCVVVEDQVKALDIQSFKNKTTKNLKLDESCLQQWWDKCLMTFDVTNANKSDLNINFHFPCFTGGIPCMTYTGPLPQ